MKRVFNICVLFSLIILGFNGCKEKDDEVEPNITIDNFASSGGQIRGSFRVLGADDVAEKGVFIGLSPSPSSDNNSNSTATVTVHNELLPQEDFYIFDDLQLGTTYYVRGYTKTKKGKIKYTEEKSFTTECLEIDSILPKNVTSSTTQIVIYGRNFSNNAMDNAITIDGDCVNGGPVVKGPSSATSTSLTVDVTNLFQATTCEAFVEVDKTGDNCNDKGGSILSKIIKNSQGGYSTNYSGVLEVTP